MTDLHLDLRPDRLQIRWAPLTSNALTSKVECPYLRRGEEAAAHGLGAYAGEESWSYE